MLSLVIILGTVTAISSWVAVAQYRRCSKLEQITNSVVSNMDTLAQLIRDTTERLQNPQLVTAFSNDDETGFFFKQIQEIQDILNQFINGQE